MEGRGKLMRQKRAASVKHAARNRCVDDEDGRTQWKRSDIASEAATQGADHHLGFVTLRKVKVTSPPQPAP
jgi:hypothetical protein